MISIFKKVFSTAKISIDSQKILTISNLLTVLRIFLTPFIVAGILGHRWVLAFILFFIAALTDLLDGYFARVLSKCTAIGASLDPIADKILLLATFAAFVVSRISGLVLPFWFLVFVAIRELIIVLGAIFLACFYEGFQIRPTIWGKATTFFQVVFVLWYFICLSFGWIPMKTYVFALIALSALSFFSLVHYIKIGAKRLRK